MPTKTKIVLDSDVLIHFIKADSVTLLLNIFPEYSYIILDVVYDELKKHNETRTVIDNICRFFAERIASEKFAPKGLMLREYARLQSKLGKGESACMVYCLEHQDVLGSSNLRDIKDYCAANNITYLATLDFLYYAFIRGKMSADECNAFIATVNAKGSKLPQIDIQTYVCTAQI